MKNLTSISEEQRSGSQEGILEGWMSGGMEVWRFKEERRTECQEVKPFNNNSSIDEISQQPLTETNHSTVQPFNHSTDNGYTSIHPYLYTSKKAFTLSEVLITLAVVGVVATMTLPTLINKIKDKQYDRAREKVLYSVGEAGRLLAIEGEINSASNAEDFVKNYLSKKLKIVKTCESSKLVECGLSETIKNLNDTTMNMPLTQADLGLSGIHPYSTWKYATNYGFVTANGYSINLFYNPNCITDTGKENSSASGYACFNAIYDMNGLRNPNQVGKDIGFVTVFYPNEQTRAVAPNPVKNNYPEKVNWRNAGNACQGNESLPDKDEILSMAINGNLIGITGDWYWPSSDVSETNSITQLFSDGGRYYRPKTKSFYVRCLKRP